MVGALKLSNQSGDYDISTTLLQSSIESVV